jgi:dihydrofolate synthase/folylpolyglutamate synthase
MGSIVLDAAHNAAGAAALADYLERRQEPVDLLCGILADKDAATMLAALAPHAHRLILTAPPSPRARDPRELAALLPPGAPAPLLEPDPERALDLALAPLLDRTVEGPATLVACGSIYLIGQVRQHLTRRFGTPVPARDVRTGRRYPVAGDL